MLFAILHSMLLLGPAPLILPTAVARTGTAWIHRVNSRSATGLLRAVSSSRRARLTDLTRARSPQTCTATTHWVLRASSYSFLPRLARACNATEPRAAFKALALPSARGGEQIGLCTANLIL
jgi:hypothetical protein